MQMSSQSWRIAGCAALAMAVFSLTGCSKATTAKVTGVVTYKGTPLTSGVVTFYGEGNNQVASCSIEPNGNYTLTDAPVGTDKITVSVPPEFKDPKLSKIPHPENSSVQAVQIPRNYSEEGKSGLTYTVEPGSQEHAIELK
jgi:type 1 fimbria pilin